MTYSFSEDQLRKAILKADLLICESLQIEKIIEHKFSNRFEKKMNVLINRSNGNANRFINKRFVAILAAVIILLSSAMSVSAIREAVVHFVTEVYEQFTHVFFNDSQSTATSGMSNEAFVPYVPRYIPNGFEIIIQDLNGHVFIQYIHGDDYIVYSQQTIQSVSMDINTEGVELEDIQIKNLPAKYYSNKGVQNVFWYDQDYLYMVYSTLDKVTIMKIADSIEKYQDNN